MYKAVLTPPMCKGPVGLGANLTRTLEDIIGFIFVAKIQPNLCNPKICDLSIWVIVEILICCYL